MDHNFYDNVSDNVDNSSLTLNNTLPDHLRFTTNSLVVVIVYCIFFLVSAFGNLTVFCSLRKLKNSHSRIDLMILHLATADLLVTFVMIPLEIGWRITVRWIAGNVACKIFLVLRAFGLYLSSNILICISLDRYFAILYPLKLTHAKRRGKLMLSVAWLLSFLCALPQSIVFHVAPHPTYPHFTQCVSFGFFANGSQEFAYNLFCVSAVYFLPLIIIIYTYTALMCKIFQKSRKNTKKSSMKIQLRRSKISNVEQARKRTLRLAITIVLVFVWCWTPYVVITLWYMIDRKSAENLPNWLQDTLFIMAVSNSCMNPIVYGSYAMGLRQKCLKVLRCCIFAKNDVLRYRHRHRQSLSREAKFRRVSQNGSPNRHNNCESKKFPSHEFIKPVSDKTDQVIEYDKTEEHCIEDERIL